MPDDLDIGELNREIHGLSGRIAALRTTHASYPEDAASTLEAILAELGLAEQLLHACLGELEAHPDGRGGRSEEAERRTLRTAFTELPVPVLLLDREGGVRRANAAAGELLGVSLASVTGKPFSLFVDLRRRAAVRSQLSAALRSERPISFETRLARRGWAEDVHLTVSNHRVPSEPTPMLMVVVAPPLSPRAGEPPPLERQVEDQIVVASARRLDIMARMTRLLLDERSRREPVALRRAARLLAGEYADWVLVDLHGELGPRRVVVAGPEGGEADRLARLLESLDPAAAELPAEVLDTGQSVLLQLLEEEDALGRTAEGVPTLNLLRAGSVVGVPLRDELGVLGVLTLVRSSNQGSFQLADLGLLEELGEHLGLAVRTERSLHRRVSAAENLQASLQPTALPGIPGLDMAASLRSADGMLAAGGDFYDVFPSGDGWGLALGDVSGRGEEAAAAAATVRHGIRLLGLWADVPGDVLRKVNEALIRQAETDRFVTALAARLDLTGRGVTVRLAGAGHPRPLVLRADGTVTFGAGGGLPLGLFADAEPASGSLQLDPGDLLLLYSDGITEAASGKGEPYGEERLADVMVRTLGLPAADAVKAVENDLEAHTGGRRRDDMAILAVRVGNPPES